MSNEVHAKAALQLARTLLGKYKSSNKFRPGETKEGVDRDRRWGKANRWRNEIVREIRGRPGPLDYGILAELATAYESGNCTEYAAIAWKYLVSKEVQAHIVGLEGDGDHAFAVAGLKQPPPRDFAEWGEDVWICDPWANICCLAADYPTAWNDRMRHWENKGKMILGKDGEPIAPTSHAWLNSIQHCEKAIRTGAPFEQAQPPRREPVPQRPDPKPVPPRPHKPLPPRPDGK
jgi:hypothetical protein